jgi:EpsI family protein
VPRKNLLLYALLAAAFLGLNHHVVAHIVRKWKTPEGSYGILILAVSIYLVWIKRHDIRNLQVAPAIVPGAVLLSSGCFIFFAGKLGSTILVQQISMIPVLLGAILLFAGFSFFKAFLLPVGYLVFLTGFIETLLGGIATHLQTFSAWIATLFFKLIRMPVFLDGTIIELPHISLEVLRPCSGIGHIVALLALSVPLAHLVQKTRARKFILFLSTLLIGLFANGLRVFLIGVYALFNEGADLHGPYEILYVSFIFFFGLLALVLISRLLSRGDATEQPADEKADPVETVNPLIPDRSGFAFRQRISFIVGTTIFIITLGFVHLYTPKAVALNNSLDTFPIRIAGFTGKAIDEMENRLRPFPADNELLRRYKNGDGISVELYIGYFEIQNRSRKVIDYRRAWMHEEADRMVLEKDGRNVAINKTRIREDGPSTDVYFWYQIGERIITSQYTGKIVTFFNGLFKRRTQAAVIVISTRNEEAEVSSLILKLFETTKTYL